MAYGRRKRYSRKIRRGRRTLSTRNIYANRGSRSQASQIAALRKRINNVYKATKPETKVWTSNNSTTNTFTNEALANTYILNYVTPQKLSQGVAEGYFVGDAYRLKSCVCYGTIEYFNSLGQTMHNSEPLGGFIRFIYFQLKQQNTQPIYQEILAIASTGTDYELNTVKPLANGVTSQYRILGDYRYRLTPFNSHIQFRHRMPIKWKNSLCRVPTGAVVNEVSQNDILVLIVTSGLHWDTDLTETIQCNWDSKIAYTDA